MIPKAQHKELPKITYTETGWRQTLAAYRIAVWHEHENEKDTADMSYREALEKLGAPKLEHMQTRIGAIKNINDFMKMKDIYTMCELLDPFTNDGTAILRMVRILAEHGVTDIRKYTKGFEDIPGIGPKYAEILNAARIEANHGVKKKIWKRMTIIIPEDLRTAIEDYTTKYGVSVDEFAAHAFKYYLGYVEEETK